MSSRFIMPFADVGSGIKPSSGAQLFFFELDGVTPKDTFSDQLTIPTANANPVISDSTGVFGDVYITGQYKVTLKDKNDSQIFGLALVEELVATGDFNTSLINDLSQSYEFNTVALMVASTIGFPENKAIKTKGYVSVDDGGEGVYINKTTAQAAADGDVIDDKINHNAGPAGFEFILQHYGTVNLEQSGAVGDDSANDSAAINAIDAHANIHRINANKIYKYTSDITFTRSIDINGSGTFNGVGAEFFIQGTLTEVGAISVSAVVEGDRTIEVTGLSGISDNDILIIQNQIDFSFSPHRSNYYDGEYAEVKSVAGDIVTLASPLESSYLAVATNKVFKMNYVVCNISGVSFLGDGSYPLTIKHALGGEINPKKAIGGINGALLINKCFRTNVLGGEYFNDSPDIGLNYGISISNSQDIDIYSATCHGTRHGTTVGGDAQDGAVPCRRIKFHNCVISNDQTTIHCTDFHGNTKDSGYYNCDSAGDAVMGGINVEYVGGSIRNQNTDRPLGAGEINGGYVRYKNVQVKFDALSVATSLFEFINATESALIENDFVVGVDDITITGMTTVTNLLNVFINAPAATKSWWSMKNIKSDLQLVGIQRVVTVSLSGTGVRPESLTVENIDLDPASIQKWMNVDAGFAGCKATFPTSQFKGSFAIGGGSVFSSGQTFTFPEYPAIPETLTETTGLLVDATGGWATTALIAPSTTTTIRPGITTTTGAAATALMLTDVISTVKMNNYILP